MFILITLHALVNSHRTGHEAVLFRLLQELARASYFLPSYDLRQASLAVEGLQASIDKAAAQLIPKQKFAFGARSRKAPVAAQSHAETSLPASPALAAFDRCTEPLLTTGR